MVTKARAEPRSLSQELKKSSREKERGGETSVVFTILFMTLASENCEPQHYG